MTSWTVSPLAVAAAVLAVPGGLLILAGLVALRRQRRFLFVLRTLLGLLLLATGSLLWAISIGLNGLPHLDPRGSGGARRRLFWTILPS
jgi:hypothetical protein